MAVWAGDDPNTMDSMTVWLVWAIPLFARTLWFICWPTWLMYVIQGLMCFQWRMPSLNPEINDPIMESLLVTKLSIISILQLKVQLRKNSCLQKDQIVKCFSFLTHEWWLYSYKTEFKVVVLHRSYASRSHFWVWFWNADRDMQRIKHTLFCPVIFKHWLLVDFGLITEMTTYFKLRE